MQSFQFKGFTFIPVRKLTTVENSGRGPKSAVQNMTHQIPHVTDTPVLKDRENGWDYNAFYQAAEAAGSATDLYRVQGQGDTLYLPHSNYLFILPPI